MEMVTHSSILAWRIPWTEDHKVTRVGHDLTTKLPPPWSCPVKLWCETCFQYQIFKKCKNKQANNFDDIFYLPYYYQIFQYIISIFRITNDMFYFLFFLLSLQNPVSLYTGSTSHFRLAMFQVLSCRVWLVVTIRDTAALGDLCSKENTLQDSKNLVAQDF